MRAMPPAPLLALDNVTVTYPGRAVLAGWSASFPAGLSLLCGGEGCGKTSVLKLLAGALPEAACSRSGSVMLAGAPLQAGAPGQLFWADPLSEQHAQLSPRQYFALQQPLFPDWDGAALARVVEGLALHEHLDKRCHMLSTGSRRKVWLAAAFAAGARVTLLDQPFAALDRAARDYLRGLLAQAGAVPGRVCIIADYDAPDGLALAARVDLGD